MTHPDVLDRLCANRRPPTRDEVLELRADAEVRGDAGMVARCERVLETLLGAGRQERAA